MSLELAIDKEEAVAVKIYSSYVLACEENLSFSAKNLCAAQELYDSCATNEVIASNKALYCSRVLSAAEFNINRALLKDHSELYDPIKVLETELDTYIKVLLAAHAAATAAADASASLVNAVTADAEIRANIAANSAAILANQLANATQLLDSSKKLINAVEAFDCAKQLVVSTQKFSKSVTEFCNMAKQLEVGLGNLGSPMAMPKALLTL